MPQAPDGRYCARLPPAWHLELGHPDQNQARPPPQSPARRRREGSIRLHCLGYASGRTWQCLKQHVFQGEKATLSDPKALLKRASATLKKKLKVHDQGGDRSSAAYAAIMTALREGFSDDEIAALLDAHPQGVGERYAGVKVSTMTRAR